MFENRQLYIQIGRLAILAKKNFIIFGTTLETTFFCENRYKTDKNRPICIKLTVLKLPEFAVFKTPEFLKSEYSFPAR